MTKRKMASAGPANPEQVAAKVKTLINSQLKQVLKKEGLPVSGAKATLQSRITDRELNFAFVNKTIPADLALLYPAQNTA